LERRFAKRFAVFSVAFLLAAPALAGATDLYVDPLGGSDVSGAGALGAPFATITMTLKVTGPGDHVHLAPGTYSPSTGETFPLVLPAAVWLLGAGVHQCVISGEGDFTLVRLKDEVLVSDVHFERAKVAVTTQLFHNDVNYLRRCRFENNDVAVHYEDWLHSDSRFVLVNCALLGNQVALQHHSTGWDFNSVTLLVFGTTITANGIAVEPTGMGERYLGLYNSIVLGNGDNSLATFQADVGVTSNVLSDPAYVGTNGNLDVSPGIPGWAEGDPHLASSAKARDHVTLAPVWPPTGYWTGATPWPWEATFGEVRDIDGQTRLVGPAGDAGCDEFRSPTVHLNGAVQLGTTLAVRLQAEPGESLLTFAGFGLYPSLVAGLLWVQPPYMFLGSAMVPAGGAAQLSVPIPSGPTLAGLNMYLQALRLGPALASSGPVWARLRP